MIAMQATAVLLLLPLLSQDAAQGSPRQTESDAPSVEARSADALVLRYYTPERIDSRQLIKVAAQLYGGELLVTQGGHDTWLPRFLELEGSILVRETQPQAEMIVASLREIEDKVGSPHSSSASQPAPLESFHYRPSNLSVPALLEGLRPYDGKVSQAGQWVPAITGSPATGTIFVRETPERAAEIRAYLEQIDVASPQATFHYLILTGRPEGPSSPALPQDLVANLARLVPADHFDLVSGGVLRGSVTQPLEIRDESSGTYYSLELRPAAFDAAHRELSIERCQFEFQITSSGDTQSRQSFRTAASLRDGEYTALGAVGPDPVFVVLRMELDGAPKAPHSR